MAKRLILIFIVALMLMLSGFASAWRDYGGIKEPYPIGVYVLIDGMKFSGITANACNDRTGYCEDAITNVAGYAQFELQNFKMPDTGIWATAPPFIKGLDKITIKVCDDKPECKQIVDSATAEVPVILRFSLGSGDVAVPEQPVKEVIKEVIKEVPVEAYGTDVTVEELNWAQENYTWFAGFAAMLAVIVTLGIAGRKRANKAFQTFLAKMRGGKYKPNKRRS